MLFGCGSPRTVAAETACEIVVLTRESLDKVLVSFPVIKEQLARIENDDKYKIRVLQAIKLSNVSYPDGEKYVYLVSITFLKNLKARCQYV